MTRLPTGWRTSPLRELKTMVSRGSSARFLPICEKKEAKL